MGNRRLNQQIQFIVEIDKLKGILRRSYLVGGERRENSAEHSWHLATMAMVLAEYGDEDIDLLRVLNMLLIHDIVEIDAGDTFCYDDEGALDKRDREGQAADRIFGLLPDDQESELHRLWEEYEARNTPESRFANALDRLVPLLLSYHAEGKTWQEHGVSSGRVLARNAHIADGSPELWRFARTMIEDAVARGYFPRSDGADDDRTVD